MTYNRFIKYYGLDVLNKRYTHVYILFVIFPNVKKKKLKPTSLTALPTSMKQEIFEKIILGN